MKQLRFETSKGKFVLVDDVESIGRKLPYDFLTNIGYLKKITEEQASKIVDTSIHTNLFAHYVNNIDVNAYCYKSAIESLHSLLESKGVHLYKNPNDSDYFTNRSTEQKTFYNPFIFKI